MDWLDPKHLKQTDPQPPYTFGLRKYLTPQIKNINAENRTVDFLITSGKPDRDNDVINPKGWDLKPFKANPVVLWAHDYSAPPVGKAIKIGKVDGGLRSRAEFVPAEVSPFAESIFQMIKGGFLNSASVGFRPTEMEWNEKRGGTDFQKQELLEWSIVPVPANADATVIEGIKAKGIDVQPILTWAESYLEEGKHDDTEKQAIETYCRALGPVQVAPGGVEGHEEIKTEGEDAPERKASDDVWEDEEAKGQEIDIRVTLEEMMDRSVLRGNGLTAQALQQRFGLAQESKGQESKEASESHPVHVHCHLCSKAVPPDALTAKSTYAETGEPLEELLVCPDCQPRFFLVDIDDHTKAETEWVFPIVEADSAHRPETFLVDEDTWKEATRRVFSHLLTDEIQQALDYASGRVR